MREQLIKIIPMSDRARLNALHDAIASLRCDNCKHWAAGYCHSLCRFAVAAGFFCANFEGRK